MLFCFVFAKPHLAPLSRAIARRTIRRVLSTSSAGSRHSNSFPLTLLSNPHPLTPVASIFYKNAEGEGAPTLQSPSPISYCPSSYPPKPFRMNRLEKPWIAN